MTDSGWRDDAPRLPDPRMIGIPEVVAPEPAPTAASLPPPGDDDNAVESGTLVRPFIVTGGRTKPSDVNLRVETLVTADPSALSAQLSFEHRHIVEICQRPLSVAEVATSLGVPIGVARVLIADLIAERLLTPHAHLDFHEFPSRSLLERICEGVRAL
jgi:Protein of unknown function (DUF742)